MSPQGLNSPVMPTLAIALLLPAAAVCQAAKRLPASGLDLVQTSSGPISGSGDRVGFVRSPEWPAKGAEPGGLGLIRSGPAAHESPAKPEERDPADALHVLGMWEGHEWGISSVGVSRDGKRALSSSKDRTILWDLATGKPPVVWKLKEGGPGRFIAFLPDGESALFDAAGVLREWDLRGDKLLAEWKGLELVKNVETGELELADVEKKRHWTDRRRRDLAADVRKAWSRLSGLPRLRVIVGGHHIDRAQLGRHYSVRCYELSPDGKSGVSGGGDDTVRLWDMASGKLLGTLRGHKAPVLSVAFSPDGKKVLSGSWDKTAKLWEVATGRELTTWEGHKLAVQKVLFSPDGRLAVTGGADDDIKVWDVTGKTAVSSWHAHHPGVADLDVTPDGKKLLSGGGDARLRLWDLKAILAAAGFR